MQRTRRATPATSGSSALSTVAPSGRVMRQTVALTSASWGSVWMPCRSRWSEERLVNTLASLDSYPMPRRTSPPRAVSSTAMSTSSRSRIATAPPGPVQSPASTIRSSTRIPSEVVVPTWCPAPRRMCVISRVTVDLPLVPVMLTTGWRRSSSRIQDGGTVDAAAIRSCHPATRRACVPVRRTFLAGETGRPARSTAASAISRARPAPAQGHVATHRPASVPRWTCTGPGCSSWSARSRRIQATRSVTASGHSRAGTVRPMCTSAPSPPSRDPFQTRARPTATSTLTTGMSR